MMETCKKIFCLFQASDLEKKEKLLLITHFVCLLNPLNHGSDALPSASNTSKEINVCFAGNLSANS